MGCLIWICLTEKASEDEKAILYLLWQHKHFFRGCRIVKKEKVGKKLELEVYVRWAENKVSDFVVNQLMQEKSVDKIKIVS